MFGQSEMNESVPDMMVWYCLFFISGWFAWFMVFNATFNNMSVISWLSVLLEEETGVPRVNHRSVARH